MRINDLVPECVRYFIFDWDGTLQDSAVATYQAYEVLFREAGLPLDLERLTQYYSPNWYTTYEALGLPQELYDWADRRWLEVFGLLTKELLPGARATLLGLRQAGYELGLLTAAEGKRLEAELAGFAIAGLFDRIATMREFGVRKPDPLGLISLVLERDLQPQQAIYVGDAVEDIQMGRAAGTYTLAVCGSFVSDKRLSQAQPDFLVSGLPAILDLLPPGKIPADGKE